MPRSPSGGQKGCYAAKGVYWMRDTLPEMGTDIAEILKIGAEQAMRVDSVQVFKPDEFAAHRGFLNGHFVVAVRKKHFHWETFTFVKAYTWPDEQVGHLLQ